MTQMYKIAGKNANTRRQLSQSSQNNIAQLFMHKFISNTTGPTIDKKGVYTVTSFLLS
jgi:hypothetical protein